MTSTFRIEKLQVGYIGANCYVLVDGPTCILVDPGDEGARILEWLVSLQLKPSLIIATHGHLDHTGAIPEVRAGLEAETSGTLSGTGAKDSGTGYPGSPALSGTDRAHRVLLAGHGADSAYFGPPAEKTNRELFRAIRASGYFTHFWKPIPALDCLLSDGDVVPGTCGMPGTNWMPGTGITVIHTPGHSAGSICLWHKEAGVLVSGDTLFRDGVGRTDAPDADSDLLQASLLKLARLPGDTKVFPGHGNETTIARELGRFKKN